MYVFAKFCRLCGNNKNVSLTSNSLDSNNITIRDKLKIVLPEILELNYFLPMEFCTTCARKLNLAYNFKMKCLEKQKQLQIYLNQLQCYSEYIEFPSTISIDVTEKIDTIELGTTEICDEKEIELSENKFEEHNYSLSNSANDVNFFFVSCEEIPSDFSSQVYPINVNENRSENIIIDSLLEYNEFGYAYMSNNFGTDSSQKLGHETQLNISPNQIQHNSSAIIYPDTYHLNSSQTQNNTQVHPSSSRVDKQNTNDNIRQKSDKRSLYPDLSKYKRQIITHPSQPNIKVYYYTEICYCQNCDRKFSKLDILFSHIRRTHFGIVKLNCSQCNYKTDRKINLKHHIETHHKEQEPQRELNPVYNMKYKGDEVYYCTICKETYPLAFISLHMKRHEKIFPIKCEMCKKTYKNLQSLEVHQMIVHSDNNQS